MFDTEKFICAIELRPCLYDVASKDYSNKQLKGQSWIDVCEEMFQNWAELTNEEKDLKGKLICFINYLSTNMVLMTHRQLIM